MKGRMTNTLATGFAIFSMFFGAGNVVFPLALGQMAKNQAIWSALGLLLTAVIVPFLGLLATTLFDGNYRQFFGRLGTVPGYFLEVLILLIIGPFGALPRTIVLSESSLQVYLPFLSLPTFSLVACIIIFFCTWKRTAMLDILGYILTPLLLLSLTFVVIVGLFTTPSAPVTEESGLQIFFHSLKVGYHTMDLLASFFFSAVVLICLKREIGIAETTSYKPMIQITIRAGIIGMGLLCLVYLGLNIVASRTSLALTGVPTEQLLGRIAYEVLGPNMGIIASIAVALACLTTAIALTAVFAEFLHEDLTRERLSWVASLAITLALSFGVTTWEFSGIANFLSPILTVCYPSLIALTLCNLAYKASGFRPVKGPVLIVFILALLAYFF